MAKRRISAVRRESAEFDRGLGFFDAVYGFAITLLIANVDMPKPEAWTNIDTLFSHGLGTQLLGFVISFVVIAVFWKVNYDLIRQFTGMNTKVIICNLVSVGLVVLIPFTTQGISDPELVDLPLPTALYALNIALAIGSQMVMYEFGRRGGLVDIDEPPAALWAARADAFLKVFVFLASIPIAITVGADWARWVWASLFVLAPISGKWSDAVIERARSEAGLTPGADAEHPQDTEHRVDAEHPHRTDTEHPPRQEEKASSSDGPAG